MLEIIFANYLDLRIISNDNDKDWLINILYL